MVGYNNLSYDYLMLHYLVSDEADIHSLSGYDAAKKMRERSDLLIHSDKEFKFKKLMVWANKRHFPQIDLMKIHHFDNLARSARLKDLQIAMGMDSVVDMPVSVMNPIKESQRTIVSNYCAHDVLATEKLHGFFGCENRR
jgi:hypothetical protein